MPGRGPAPKRERVRPNDTARREAEFVRVADDGTLRGPDLPEGEWPVQTLLWWDTWRSSPLAQTFGDTDWQFLLDSALLHAELWRGNLAVAPELRLRVAKFGATPEDRARLRMQFAQADEAERSRPVESPRDRYAGLRAVGGGHAVAGA